MAISKRTVLRSGFCVIVGLPVLSTFLAYEIQESFSQGSVAIHRRFVHEQELLTNLRRTLWMTGIAARDYLLNPAEDSEKQFQSQFESLRRDGNSQLDALKRSSERGGVVAELDQRFRDLWKTLDTWSMHDSDPHRRYAFIQQEIVPRRDAAGRLLRELERANQSSLAESEQQFTEQRVLATNRLLAVLALSLLASIVVVHLSLRNAGALEKEAANRFAEVLEAKLELERLSARLMEIQEEERTRLSRELHDEIVQNLAVLKIEITRASALVQQAPAEMEECLRRARELAERTVRTVRDISLLLRPSLLDDLGLGPALQWQAEDFTRRTGTPCDLDEQNLAEDLPDTVKTCVFRVTQEALRNCEKHSAATRVHVSVIQSEHELTVEVTDNGIGFRPSEVKSPFHLGLLGMRERAAALGGGLVTDSAPLKGTTVRLTLPLPSARPLGRLEAHA